MRRLFDEKEFLSTFGIRSVSRIHAERRDLGVLPGIGQALIEYVPGESNSGLFGGNSNWRGPVWLPTNYVLILALEKFNRFLGDGYTVSAPGLADGELTLREVIDSLARRMTNLYRPMRQVDFLHFRPIVPGNPILIGVGIYSSSSIFMATTGLVWARRIRPDGPGCWLIWCCVVMDRILPDSKSERKIALRHNDGDMHEHHDSRVQKQV